jgi:hypothetical protein
MNLAPGRTATFTGCVKTADGRLRRTAAFRLHQRPQSGRASIFSNAWAFPGRHLSSNTESDLDTNVVRTLKQPEGCGPSESAVLTFFTQSL